MISEISSHTTGRVYLVRHRNLKEIRICKEVYKNTISTSDFLEADILLHLNHPAIVRIYDLLEDEDSFFLLEEYVAGQSLGEYILYNSITHREIINIAISLCQIMEYLHSLERPVLYLDLKPDNIIYRDGDVKLVDFGSAIYEDLSGLNQSVSITEAYLAPETIEGNLGRGQDMYALAKVLQKLYDCVKDSDCKPVLRLINRQITCDPSKRYDAAGYLAQWLSMQENNIHKEAHQVRRLYVAGSHESVGTSFVAVAITATLNYMGYRAVYVEATYSGQVDRIGQSDRSSKASGDLIYHRNFIGLRENKDYELIEPSFDFLVIDTGCQIVDVSHDELMVIVYSSCPWKTRLIPNNALADNSIVLVNPASKGVAIALAKELKKEVYAFEPDGDVFAVTKNKRLIVSRILEWYKNEGMC